ncbi:hypothetical protein [Aquirufa sp. Wall-65K1]
MRVLSKFKSSDNHLFIKVSQFKIAIGGTFKVVYYEESDKYSVLDEFGVFYRCQHNINVDQPMAFLLERGKDIEDVCLVNIKKEF